MPKISDLARRPATTGGNWLPVLFLAAVFVVGFVGLSGRFPVPLIAAAIAGLAFVCICLFNTLIAAVILVVAMMFSPEFQITPGLRVRVSEIAVPLIVAALAARTCIPRFRVRFRSSILDLCMLTVCLVNAVSSVRAVGMGWINTTDALVWNGKILLMFLVYWLSFNFVREPRQIRGMMMLALVVLVVVTLITFTQIPGTQVHTANRLTAPFEGTPEPTTLGGYLTLLLAFVMAFAIYEPNRGKAKLFWLLAAVVFVPILFTLSRTTYMSCGLMILFLAILTRNRTMLFLWVFALLLSPVIFPDKIVARVMMTFDDSRMYGLDPSLTERIFVWQKAGHTLRIAPLLGLGVPHGIMDSMFARIIVETGLLGLGAWLSVLAVCFRLGRRLHRRATIPAHKALGAGYLVGVLALLVHATATITFYIVRIMEPFWFLTGLIASLDRWYAGQESLDDSEER